MFESLPLVVDAPSDTDSVVAAASCAADQWGMPAPELIRIGQNGVFTSGDAILRVGIATAPMSVAIRFADLLDSLGIRVARPVRHDWLAVGALSVTAWERIDFDADAAIDWERIGQMVARVHTIDPTSIDHPLPFCADFPWWRFSSMIDEVDRIDAAARDGLRSALSANDWWIHESRRAPLVVCHGDVHPGNVLVAADGPVLIDWDLLCVGPPEWDHAPLMRWAERWGGVPGTYEAFAAGYGRPIDVRRSTAIAEMRLIAATLMRLRRGRVDPAAEAEAQRRLAYWRGDPGAPVWRAQ